jgi:hypothetical protein
VKGEGMEKSRTHSGNISQKANKNATKPKKVYLRLKFFTTSRTLPKIGKKLMNSP